MFNKCKLALAALLVLILQVYGQVETETPFGLSPINISAIGFRQEFNSYNWNYQFSTTKNIAHRFSVNLTEKFRSSMLRLTSSEDRWKDDQNLIFQMNYLLFNQFTLQSKISSVVFKDNQSGFFNDIQTHIGSFGLKFTRGSSFAAAAEIGPKWDSRFDQNDRGTGLQFDANVRHLKWDEYDNNLTFALGQDRFDRRQNRDLNFNYLIHREFAEGTGDSLRIFDTYRRRDNYTSIQGDIESLSEGLRGLENVLTYEISPAVNMVITSQLQQKEVQVQSFSSSQEKERKRNDQRISNDLAIHIANKYLKSRMNLSYWSQDQRYAIDLQDENLPFSRQTAFVTPDNESKRLLLVTDLGFHRGRNDSVYAYFSASKFQYDTPDTNNFDDRDELRINTKLLYSHRLSRNLLMAVEAGVNFYHLVYIFNERSADNNWNRIFRLQPSLDFNPNDKFRLKQSFEVLANYIDYDFDEMNLQTKSFVFRKFAVDDSLRWRVGKFTTIGIDYRLQLEENGQLSWENWTERVLVTRRSQWLRCSWNYANSAKITLSPGLVYYSREEWRHNSDPFGGEIKEKLPVFYSFGPSLRLVYSPSKRMQLLIDSIRQAVHSPNRTKYYLNNINVRLNWYL